MYILIWVADSLRTADNFFKALSYSCICDFWIIKIFVIVIIPQTAYNVFFLFFL